MKPLLCFLLASIAISTQAAKVVLVAGKGEAQEGQAPEVKLRSPFGVDFDKQGNMFIVEMTGEYVKKMAPSGMVTIIGGTGVRGGEGDGGPALQTQLNGIHNLAVHPSGDIYLADTWNNRVRKIDSKTGIITTVAGTGKKGFSGDGGLATNADFGGIYCASLDPKAENLYMADLDNRRIRVMNLKSGIVKTVAGNGKKGVPKDGDEATKAPLVDPRAVIADNEGNVYVLERSGHALRVVTPDGKIRTIAGTGAKGYSGDGGDALKATLNGPKHLCFDLEGNILIADTENHVIRKLLLKQGKLVHVAGTGTKGSAGLGGPPDKVQLNQPHGVYVHPSGVLYISDSSNHRVLKLEP